MVLTVSHLSEIEDRVNPSKVCDHSTTSQAKPTSTPNEPPQVKVYTCDCDYPSKDDTKKSLFLPTGTSSFAVYDDNDNKGLGAWGAITGKDGNDLGYTNGVGLSYAHMINKDGVLTFDLTSKLFTKPATLINSNTDPNLQSMANSGIIEKENVNGIDENLYQQNIEDVTRLMGTFEKDKRGFYYRLGTGVEIRQTDPSKTAPAWTIQNWWHSKVLGEKLAEQYQAIGANGIKSTVTTRASQSTQQISQQVWDSYYAHAVLPGQPNPYNFPILQGCVLAGQPNPNHLPILDPTKHTLTYSSTSAEVNDGVKENKDLQTVSPVSILGSFDLGTRTEVLQGKCELQLEAGGFLSTEGKKFIGPNSYIHVKGDAKSTVLHKKNGDPRLNAELSTQVLYFPTPKNYSPSFGFTQSMMLESFHRMGKNGNTISPFLVVYIPSGRNSFQSMNDNDSIMRFGVRFNFK